MKIAIGSDHAGRALKDEIGKHLADAGHEITDLGTHSDDSVDYPDYGAAVGEAVASGAAELGVCCCGTGIGISMAANKVRGIRAAVVHDVTTAHYARAHNNANVVCLGGRTTGVLTALDAIDEFFATSFEGGRHERRIEKIAHLEEKL